MENVKPSSNKIAFKWAIIYIITSIIITFAFQFLNIDQNSAVKYIGYIPFIAFLLLAQKEFKDQLGGYITIGEGFSSGFIYSVFSGLMGAVFIYIYLAFVNPHLLEQAAIDAQAKMQEQGRSADQIEMAVNMTKKYGAIFGAIGTVIGLIIIGAIVALIGAAIFKKERSHLDVDTDSYSDPVV